jgi:hypothetical protein
MTGVQIRLLLAVLALIGGIAALVVVVQLATHVLG